ncbi:sigma 54-interacting transcriptional regulator [Myxococcota bacterium]|nr:sigma 54-interacting transcriptional regulator [Myxococcota bacterium]
MKGGARPTVQRERPTEAGPATRLRRLTLVYGPGVDAMPFRRLDREPLVLGREPGKGGFALPGEQASRRHAVVRYVPDYDLYRVEDLDSTNGTFIDGRRIEKELLRNGEVLRLGDCLLVLSEIPANLPWIASLGDDEGTTSRSLRITHTEALADRVAPSGLPVLIQGPTGAGKERLAARVHERSRRSGPLVAVNCAAFSKEMLASELFGHRKGTFTGGTTDRAGLIASSAGGTLFLDEIAELPLDQQPALLRVLQEKKVRPVGGDREVAVDVRVVAATHQNLAQLEEVGAFRADLRARLEGVRLALPGLIDRPEDILPIFRTTLGAQREARGSNVEASEVLTLEAAEALLAYGWPRNIREIHHVAGHVALFWDADGAIPPEALPDELRRISGAVSERKKVAPTKEQLEALLREHHGNVTRVAATLGEHRTQVSRWLRAFKLNPAEYRWR